MATAVVGCCSQCNQIARAPSAPSSSSRRSANRLAFPILCFPNRLCGGRSRIVLNGKGIRIRRASSSSAALVVGATVAATEEAPAKPEVAGLKADLLAAVAGLDRGLVATKADEDLSDSLALKLEEAGDTIVLPEHIDRLHSVLPPTSTTTSSPPPHPSSRLAAASCSKSFPGRAARRSPVLRRKQQRSLRCYDDSSSGNIAFPAQNLTRLRHGPCGTATCALHEGKEYEEQQQPVLSLLNNVVSSLSPVDLDMVMFREDGSELEVRVPLPSEEDAGRRLTARYVAVDAQAMSLVVGVETTRGVQILLNASSLFGSIKPSETVWFVDETEVVLSLKKADDELSWPDLIEAWQSLAKGVSTLLKGTSVCVVGESTEINWAVAQELATGLEYVPLQTQQLIEHVAKASINEIISEDGEDTIGEIEDAVLKNLGQHVRCVVATLGGNNGAAAQYGRWNGLHSGFSVWLSQSQAHDEESAKEEVVRVKEAGSLAYSKADAVVALSGWDSTAVRPTAEGCLRALKYLLVAEKDLPGKKSLYVRLGCRGDWPEIQPPGWNPNRPEDEVKRAQQLAV